MPDRNKILSSGDVVVVLPGKSVDEIFLMVLCLISAIPIIFGAVPAPGSIDATMPQWAVFAWSVVLALGALVVLVSFLFKDRVTGMIVEQFGSVCLGSAAALYGSVIFATSYDDGGAIPSSLILGFAVARFLQFRLYQKKLDQVNLVLRMIAEEEARAD